MKPESRGEMTLGQLMGQFLGIIRSNLLLFAVVGGLSLVGGYSCSYLFDLQYRSRATLLPPADKSPMGGMLAQLGAVSGMLGVGGGDGLDRLYPDIIKSRRIMTSVLEREFEGVPLLDILNHEQMSGAAKLQRALDHLSETVTVRDNIRTGLIEVFFQDQNPELAAFVLTALLEEVDAYLQGNLRGEATQQLEMIETRLEEIKASLVDSEERLKAFKEANSLPAQSPKLSLEQGRLLREVEINSETYIALMKQRELVRLQASEDSAVLRVLDDPVVPLDPFWPRRVRLAGLFLMLGLAGAFVFAAWKDHGKTAVPN